MSAVELRCGMCDGSGVDDQPDRGGGPQACWMCDGTATVVAHLDGKYVVRSTAFVLWDAATDHWRDSPSDDDERPRPLGEMLFDSSAALPGSPLKGKTLYGLGVALGFIDPIGDA